MTTNVSTTPAILQFQNLEFQISPNCTPILENIQLEIFPKQLVSIIGASGSGKSTLLKIISGLISPTHGSVLIDNKNVKNIPANKRPVGFVFQDFALFPHMNVNENILVGISSNNVNDPLLKKLLEISQIEHLISKFPHELSGGEKQRVQIIRTLIRSPKIVLLDEPFSSLDSHLRKTMAYEIKKIFQEFGITAILVTHDISEAFLFSDVIGILKNRTIQQWGTPENVFYNSLDLEIAETLGIAFRLKSHPQKILRPNQIQLHKISTMTEVITKNNSQNEQIGVVIDKTFEGNFLFYKVQLQHTEEIIFSMELFRSHDHTYIEKGDAVKISVNL